MRVFIELYVSFNMFIAGFYLGDNSNTSWAKFLGMLLFGSAYFVLTFAWESLQYLFRPLVRLLDRYTMIPFYFGLYVMRTFDDTSEEVLEHTQKCIDITTNEYAKRKAEKGLRLIKERQAKIVRL